MYCVWVGVCACGKMLGQLQEPGREITGREIEIEGKHSKSDEDRRGYERSGGMGREWMGWKRRGQSMEMRCDTM